MSGHLADVFLLALVATANPTLLAATTAMLLLPHSKRLMLGYLLGAYATSIVSGLLIVFALHGSAAESTARHTIGPIEDIVIGTLLLAIAFVLATGRDAPLRQRRERRKAAKRDAGHAKAPWSERMLAKGSPRLTFVAGALLSFPGLAYLAALDQIVKLDAGPAASVLLVLFFCVMQQILLELSLFASIFAPDQTRAAVARFRGWLARSGRRAAVIGSTVLGLLILGRGLVTLLS
jgi:hypothetical protein